MAGYVRQSAADIVTGADVLAAPLNAEFNQLQNAFNGTTGHGHSGGSGDGPKLSLTASMSGVLPIANGGTAGATAAAARTALGLEIGLNVQAWDTDLDGLAGLTYGADLISYSTGLHAFATTSLTSFSRTLLDDTTAGGWLTTLGVTAFIQTLLDDADAATARATLGVVIGTNVQPSDATLTALAAYNTNGLLTQTSQDNFTGRTIAGPAAGITVTNGDGVSGNPTLALANDLAALEAMNANGIVTRTASETYSLRTLTGTANEITVTNGDGVSGNPTLNLPAALTFTGKTVTGGTFNSGAFNGTLGATTPASAVVTTLTTSGAASIASLTSAGKPPTNQDFSASGTWTRPANCKYIIVEAVGGGGGSGGINGNGTGTNATAGGGSGFGGSTGILDVSADASATVTIGAGGTAGDLNTNGGSGGFTRITIGGVVYTWGGGVGSDFINVSNSMGSTEGGQGGIGTNVIGTSQQGGIGIRGLNTDNNVTAGAGGSSIFGTGGLARHSITASAAGGGLSGTGFGAGASGAFNNGPNSDQNGAAGTGGFMRIWEFY